RQQSRHQNQCQEQAQNSLLHGSIPIFPVFFPKILYYYRDFPHCILAQSDCEVNSNDRNSSALEPDREIFLPAEQRGRQALAGKGTRPL
ncbi:MAG: hypothetical protein RR288_07030, partial [Oscillibacter sp.]